MEINQTIKVKSFLDVPAEQLRGCTREEGQAIFVLAPKEISNEPLPDFMTTALEEDFLLRIMRARLGVSTVTVTPYLQILLSAMMDSPGKAVLWAYTVLCLARKLNKTTVALADFVYAFADGFPNEDAMRELWDAQKHRNAPAGNLLDTNDVWQWGFNQFHVEVYNKRAMDLN